MKIYKVTVNELADTPMLTTSAFKADRTPKKIEYFINKSLADRRANEIYDGAVKLLGFIPKIEAIVTEIEVKEE